MPSQALLKATLLKETYVPLVDLDGAEKNHLVVRVLPSRLSLMERRLLDQIAPNVFPVKEQFNELRQAARLQKAGFQVQDVINVYERLLAASATNSNGYATVAEVDENFTLAPVELHQLLYVPKENADDDDFNGSENPGRRSSPLPAAKDTPTIYRNAIFENVMIQVEDKWRESSLEDTENVSKFQNAEESEAEPGRTPLASGGTNEGSRIPIDDCDMSTTSRLSAGTAPKFRHNGSLEISFNIPVARGSPEDSAGAVLTSTSWRCYFGCYSNLSSSTLSSGGSAATATASMLTTGSPTMDGRNTRMRESVLATVVGPIFDNNGGKANVTKQPGETANGELQCIIRNTLPSPYESKNSLRKLLGSSDPLINTERSQAALNHLVFPKNSTDEYDEVKGERSFMSVLRRASLDDDDEGHAEQSNGNHTDARDQHFADVVKSESDRLRVGTRKVSPSRLSRSNSSTKSDAESQNLSETSGKSQTMMEPGVLPEATQGLSDGRTAGVENSSASVHGNSRGRSIRSLTRSPIIGPIRRSSPSFLESLSTTESGEARKDFNSSGTTGVQNATQNSPSTSHGGTSEGSPGIATQTFLRSLSMNETTSFAAQVKHDFSSGKAGLRVPAGVPSAPDEFLRGRQHRPLERLSKFFRSSKSMKERTLPIASASKTIGTTQGMPDGSASRTTRLQPVVDCSPSDKTSKQSREHNDTTDPHGAPPNASLLAPVLPGNDARHAVKRSRPKLRTLIDDARDEEFEQEMNELSAKTASTCSIFATLKSMVGYRKHRYRVRRAFFSGLGGVDPVNNSSKVIAHSVIDLQTSPKRSVHKSGTPIVRSPGRASPRRSPGRASPRRSPGRASPRRSPGRASPRGSPGRSPGRASPGRSPGRSPRSSPNRTMIQNRKADQGSFIRNALKPVWSRAANDFMQRRLPNWSSYEEVAWPQGVSTNIRLGSMLDGRLGSGVSTDTSTSAGRNQTGMQKVYPALGHRQLRSRSASSRFRREYMKRQEGAVQSPTVVVEC